MNKSILKLCEDLSKDIKKAYEAPVTMEEAERLAAKFLGAQLSVAGEMQIVDLDARMKKSGTKAVKAAIYMEAATKGDKKPSDSFIQSVVDMSEITASSQNELDEAEVTRDALQNYYNVFKEAHIFFRGIAKGNFNG